VDHEATWLERGFAPLHISGPVVERVAARLRQRAISLGHQPIRRTRRLWPHRQLSSDLATLLQAAWYLGHNPDVAAAGFSAETHYQLHGRAEGRLPCPVAALLRGLGLIDPGLVTFTMGDIVAAGADPVRHFCYVGWKERRRPNRYFDTGWYVDTHGSPPGINPLVHYVLWGEARGIAPCRQFDPGQYRKRFALPSTHCLLAHFLQHEGSHQSQVSARTTTAA
jgi:hypothetical protein